LKNTILGILKYVLIVLACILVILFAFALVFIMDWPWWVGIFLLLGIAGIAIGVLFLRKLLLRRKEQQFVQQVIEQDESYLKQLGKDEHAEQKELQNRWKEAIETLRRSHLKKQGNPLYVLPWYLVMGESASGKTTALNSARLSSPFFEVNRTSGISGTRNCDWWFFEQAIIIDTAGRYAIPVDEGKDKDEWQKFMSLLVKYRKKEPIHGLIVTVAADKLLKASPEELEEDGLKIRRRIDELMRAMGIKFPVYLLVTKCDLIRGMTQFSDRLPEQSLEQSMGVVNQDMVKDVTSFLTSVMSGIGERLRNLRLLLLHQPENSSSDDGFLLFPEEFENLNKGLSSFVKAAFKENPYQETPILRGLYFSSGRQEGTPYSHFLNALGLTGAKEVLPGTSRGLFLHDFFAKILPRDKGLFAPTKRAVEWQMITRNLGLASWILVGLALSGLLSYSFVKNLSTIRKASHVVANAPAFKGDFALDAVIMEKQRKMILEVESANRHWWTPRFGLNQSKKVETELKAQYCRQFRERFLVSFDKRMNNTVIGLAPANQSGVAGQYIVHLVRRINLLKTRLGSSDLAALQAKPLPEYVFDSSERANDPETRKLFGNLYLNYLLWRTNHDEVNREIVDLQALLQRLFTIGGSNLQWLVDWANRDGSASAITLRSFWGGSVDVPNEQTIVPAYTRKGKEIIDSFIGELVSAYPEPAVLDRERIAFANWYRDNCFTAWRNFAAVFPAGAHRLKGANEWKQVAATMATDQGPVFSFLNKMTSELEPLAGTEGLPPWLEQAFRYRVLNSGGAAGAAVAGAAEQGKKGLGKLENLFGGKKDGTTMIDSQTIAMKALQEYRKSLTSIASISQSRNQAYQMALQAFSEDQASSSSPFYAASGSAARFKTSFNGDKADDIFWNIFSQPVDFLWAYARNETSCSVQQQWEEKVLQEAQGVANQQAMQYLLSQDGPVWKFAKGPAAPFMGWRAGKGYYSKVALGGSLPFEPALFTFLSKGASAKVAAPEKQNYPVGIRGLPTDANADARVKPQSTRLELHCASGSQTLENLNFPVSRNFTWSPETCSDVTLQIDVGDLTLLKKYSGPEAFPAFLRSFSGGSHTFTPSEFPVERRSLERHGIRFIRVNYRFSGDGAITRKAVSLPGQAPRTILRCWD